MADRAQMDRTRETTHDIIHNAHSAQAGHGGAGAWLTALASAVALIFSGYSLWETSLKQPNLSFYVAPVIHYTRDTAEDLEVFAVPLTIANTGARDGAVLTLELTVKAVNAPDEKVFYSAYSADARYFGRGARFNPETRRMDLPDRPKTPFAPISIPGRGTYTGTVLFYTKGKAFPKIIADKGQYEIAITGHLEKYPWIDALESDSLMTRWRGQIGGANDGTAGLLRS